MQIKVLFFRNLNNNKNTASFSREEAVIKMLNSEYKCVVIDPPCFCNSKINKYQKAISVRISYYWNLRRIYSLSTDKSFSYIIFLNTIRPFAALVANAIAKSIGAKLAIERNEYPYYLLSKKSILTKWLYKVCILSWHYRLFDLIFLMSDDLCSFYKAYSGKKTVIQKLPMTVDFDRFNLKINTSNYPYLFYCGSLFEHKDGIESLIKAFSKVSISFPELRLKVAGSSKNGSQEILLRRLILELSLEDKVLLLGSVERNEIPSIISDAKILVLPRPDSLQARGGFPTKLGEYLASSKPVIVTRVGEIPKYLSEDDVFFISPYNIINELADKIKFIMDNYEFAKEVGKRGYKAAHSKFGLTYNQSFIKNGIERVFKE